MSKSPFSQATKSGPARVMVVEDHPLVRLGLSHTLASHPRLNKCGEADCEADAWQLFERTKPDAAIIDLTLTSGTGLDLIKRIVRKRPGVRIVVLSMHDKSVYEERSLRAGASAFVAKDAGAEVLMAALDQALFQRRKKVACEGFDAPNLQQSQHTTDPTDELTDRELEIFRLIGQGMSTRKISELQSRSIKTIESYRAKIKKKIGVTTSEELARDAVRWVVEHEAG